MKIFSLILLSLPEITLKVYQFIIIYRITCKMLESILSIKNKNMPSPSEVAEQTSAQKTKFTTEIYKSLEIYKIKLQM